jgi:hypothetical protein
MANSFGCAANLAGGRDNRWQQGAPVLGLTCAAVRRGYHWREFELEGTMRRSLAVGAAVMAMSLGGCVGYHQEVAALRMPRPAAEPPELAAYAPPNADYPTVGGNILKGTAPTAAVAFDATSEGRDPAPPPDPSHP